MSTIMTTIDEDEVIKEDGPDEEIVEDREEEVVEENG